MSKRSLNVLLVEPEEVSTGRIAAFLAAEDDSFSTNHVAELTRGMARLAGGGFDVVVLDLDLPDSTGLATFERMSAFAPHVPIVVVTDNDDEELALAAVQGGAQDLLLRSAVTGPLLVRSLRYAVERHRLLSALRRLSLIDDLTGLYNRRGFGELGEQYLHLARRTGNGLTVLSLDVDRFKTINDTMGHHVGDQALRRIAEILRGSFRGSDLLARLGSDGFAVLAPDTSDESPDSLAQRVRGAIQAFNDSSRDPFRLSMSIGAARYDAGTMESLDDLMAVADQSRSREKSGKRRPQP